MRQRCRRNYLAILLTGVAVLLTGLAAAGCDSAATASRPGGGATQAGAARTAQVAYAVDGDTLRVRLPSGALAYVRLVGIDTPEDVKEGTPVECGARAAADSMERLAPEGARVRLRYDSVAGREDDYGRILAHAWVGGRQLEVVQLHRGLAYVYRYDDQRFNGLARFDAAEAGARSARRGSWRRCGGDFHSAEPGLQR